MMRLIDLFKSAGFSRPSQIYLCFVTASYIVAGCICAGLFLGVFGFTDSISSRILAVQLTHSMIRSAVPAALMTVLLELRLK